MKEGKIFEYHWVSPGTLLTFTCDVLASRYNGYAPSVGFIESRQAVAEYCQHQAYSERYEITAKDVILCSGCSCSLVGLFM